MIGNKLIKKLGSLHRGIYFARHGSTDSQVNIQKLEEESTLTGSDFIDDEAKAREEQIQKSRNKSRLNVSHRNMLLDQNPYPEPRLWHHGTVKYLRKTYGRYGSASGVNPAICWPTKEELSDMKEYESVKYPFTIPQMMADAKQQRKEKEERVLSRQADISKKMQKLEQWKRDLSDRISKKENEAKVAKERKERLVEEVRSHFGFTVDPKDERFKEMLEKKEKEQKKVLKEAKKKAQQEKILQQLKKKNEPQKTEEIQEKTKEEVEQS